MTARVNHLTPRQTAYGAAAAVIVGVILGAVLVLAAVAAAVTLARSVLPPCGFTDLDLGTHSCRVAGLYVDR
ncbi:MAG: hypothetical protein L0H84_15090 [Pseudonocardia sp.]|nr:hypothetical protein [Pseudonocardia sp.]